MNKKFAVTITLGIEARTKDQARQKMIALVENSESVTDDGKFLSVRIAHPEGIIVEEIVN